MTKPIVYDFKRGISSKSTLILVVLTILLGFFVISHYTSSDSAISTGQVNFQLLTWYYSTGHYHFLGFVWNASGQPTSGAQFVVNITVLPPNSENCTTSSRVLSSNASTDSQGKANLTLSAPINPSYSVCVAIPQYGYPFQPFITPYAEGSSNSTLIPQGEIVPLFGNQPAQLVNSNSGNEQQAILATWVAPFGKLPIDYGVYYQFSTSISTQQCTQYENSATCTSIPPDFQNLTESSMQPLGNMTGYLSMFKMPPIPSNLQAASTSTLVIGVFSPNGTIVGSPTAVPTSQAYPRVVSAAGATVFFFEQILAPIVLLLAFFGSFITYGKDRISGVLESVLAQPISRTGLSISRFSSCFSALALAVTVALAVTNVVTFGYAGVFLDNNLVLSSLCAVFVELGAFIALTMFLSRVLKTEVRLIASGIGLFFVFSFLWNELINLVSQVLIPNSFGTSQYYQLQVVGEFLDPAQFILLVQTYITHNLSFGLSSYGVTINPSAYGITVFSLAVGAALWIGLPLAAFLYHATRRD